jgi:DNA-binding response OmpR family regulator
MRILAVEDDEVFGAAVQKALTRAGYAVDWVRAGNDATLAMATHKYNGVLLDLGLPDVPGEVVLTTIRRRDPGTWVVVLTARGEINDRVRLLDIGADDYMVKPVDLEELGARLRAVARRTQDAADRAVSALEHGPLRLDPATHQVAWHGELVRLTNKEFWLLETFMRKKSQVLTRAQLEDALYGWGEEIGSNTVEVYVHYLRRKFAPDVIHTVRGVGYQLGSMSPSDA